MDTYGSRSLAVGGVALYHAAERIVGRSAEIPFEIRRRVAGPQLGLVGIAAFHGRGRRYFK